MPKRSYILATAGHVDHGKSALVRTLTGTDPDRLPEEKARGITIDLGFAHLDLGTDHLGIVDVPGHEDFVKNMVAGVGSIDLALFVVAADDGWMPQTEEHLQILLYLGVTRAVVAMTKVDLAADEAAARAQIGTRLKGTPFESAPIVGTSIVANSGFDALRAALATVLKDLPPQRDVGKPRLPVDRAFVLKGVGTVVTGTLTGGPLKRGQGVVVQPSGRAARVRTMQTHNAEVEAIVPGSRVALNLPDLQVDADGRAAAGTGVVQRGDVITLADLGKPSDTIDVVLERSGRGAERGAEDAIPAGGASRRLKDATRVRVHLGSGDFPCRVYFIDGEKELPPGGRSLAQLRFEQPVFAFAGDRFIVRDWPEQHTLAGGIVLDPDAVRRGYRQDARREFLRQRSGAPDAVLPFVRSELTRLQVARRPALLLKSRFSAAEVAHAVAQLAAEGAVVVAGDVVADAARWKALHRKAADAVDADHKAKPEQLGVKLTDLRAAVGDALPEGESAVFDSLVAEMCRNGFVRAGALIRRSTHRPALPPRLQAAGARIRTALAAKPFDPPARRELAPDAVSQQALRFLLETGEAVEVGDDAVLSSEGYARAVDAIRTFLRGKGSATVSELKPVLGVSRRIMVPLLERLDRDGVTLRKGDVRVLRSPA
jgi:selenocysteine-specific elongation factor